MATISHLSVYQKSISTYLRLFFVLMILFILANISLAQCTATVSSYPHVTAFELNDGDWSQDMTDSMDMSYSNTSTPSSDTGPSAPYDGSYFTFVEASGNSPSKVANIISPCYDFTGTTSPSIEFAYHLFGSSIGIIKLQASTNNGTTWTDLWSETTSQGNVWLNEAISLSSYQGSTALLRFSYTTGSTWSSDFALDQVVVHGTTNSCTATINGQDTICLGSATTLTASTGIDYLWNTGSTNNAITVAPTAATNYIVTVTDASLCTAVAQLQVNVSSDLSALIDYNGSECLSANSELSAIATGGEAPYTYTWLGPDSFMGNQQTVSINNNGNYFLTITDSYGCEAYSSGFVYEQYEPLIVNLNTDLCEGDQITLNVSTTSNATYQWDANAGSSTSSSVIVTPGPPSTTYTVTVTNDVGCVAVTSSVVNVEPRPTISLPSADLCVGETTQIVYSSTGSFSSSNAAVAVVNNSGLITATGAGTTSIIYTDGATGCTSSGLLVTVFPTPEISVSSDFDVCDGEEVSITASGTGAGTLSYAWDNGLGSGATKIFNVSGNNTNNTVTTYTATVTDGNGCTDSDAVDITVLSNPAPTYTIQEETCGQSDGSITFSFNNHPQRNTIRLSINGGGSYIQVNDNLGSFVFQGLPAGQYDLKTQWSNGDCPVDLGLATVPGSVVPNLAIVKDDGPCGASSNSGSLTFTFSDDPVQTTFEISLNGGLTFPYSVADNSGSFVIPNLTQGNYDVRVRWSDGSCPTDMGVFSIFSTTNPIASVSGDLTICEGIFTTLVASGGATYEWNTTATSKTITVSPASTTTYTVTVSNSAGCTDVESVTVVVDPAVTASIDFNGSECLRDDSQLTGLATSGTSPFSYNWTGPSTFTGNTPTVDINTNGNYYLTITDAKGCEASTSGFIYQEFQAFIVNLQAEVCEGESVDLNATGTNAVSYQWGANAGNATSPNITVSPSAPSETYSVTIINDVGCTSVGDALVTAYEVPVLSLAGSGNLCQGETIQASSTTSGIWSSSNNNIASVSFSGVITAAAPGTAIITFADINNGCPANDPLTIVVNDRPEVTMNDDQICIGETAILSPSTGGIWTSQNTAIATVTPQGVVTGVSDGLVKFDFIDDATGCSATTDQSLVVNPDPAILVPTDEVVCIGSILQAQPATGGLWTSSNTSVATITNSGSITAVSNGDVTFTFYNTSTGCTSQPSEVLTISGGPAVDLGPDDDICVGGQVQLSPGTVGTWQSSAPLIAAVDNNGLVTGLAPGMAVFRFTSGTTGCISDYTDSLTVNEVPFVIVDGPDEICTGSTTNILPATGGTWISEDNSIATITNTGEITAVGPGTVKFKYTDNTTGCTSDWSESVVVFNGPEINLEGPANICLGDVTTLQPSSGGSWSTDDSSIASVSTSGQVTGVGVGTTILRFTETVSGCQAQDFLTITVLPKPVTTITGSNIICVGGTSTIEPNTNGTWISSNTDVATITNNGIITSVGQGVVQFTFVSDAGCSSSPSSPFIAYDTPETIVDGDPNLCIDGNLQMLPATGGTWTSTDISIATITNGGAVTAVSAGQVRFIYTDDNTLCSSDPSDIVNVYGPPAVDILGDGNICVGSFANLVPSVGGVWESSDPAIATVQNDGLVIGVAEGKVVFRFTSLATGCISNPTDSMTVSIGRPLNYTGPTELCIGAQSSIAPADNGIWTSTDELVATISNEGIITATGVGSVQFIFNDALAGCTSESSTPLIVNGPPTVTLDGSGVLCVGSTTNVTSSGLTGTWSSSNTNVATVDNNGLVTAVDFGLASFIFTDDGTGCTSTANLTVNVVPPSNVGVVGDTEICIGTTTQLTPSTGGSWVSTNTNVATVSQDGVVTAKAPGVLTFIFTDAATGCVSETSADPITVSKCITADFNVATPGMILTSDVSFNDQMPTNTIYGANNILLEKPAGSLPFLLVDSNGNYTFSANLPGVYRYKTSVCGPTSSAICPTSLIEITVVADVINDKNPVANIDIATTVANSNPALPGQQISIQTLENDRCMILSGCSLDDASVTITQNNNGAAVSVGAGGVVSYTPAADFVGQDTLTYIVCNDDSPAVCDESKQIIMVNHASATNSIYASDDFIFTTRGVEISDNARDNDEDIEGDNISVVAAGSSSNPIAINGGSYYINTAGDYTFTPNSSFVGNTEIPYTICDDNTDQACKNALIHILVFDNSSLSIRVLLEGPLHNNTNARTPQGAPLMRDNLRSHPLDGNNYIPGKDPYTYNTSALFDFTSSYPHVGPGNLSSNQIISDSASVFAVTGRDAIVDWVYIELRSKDNMLYTVATRSALLQRDGDVVDLDGVSPVRFDNLSIDSAYVVVKHRLHLAAMTEVVSLTKMIDFSDPETEMFDFGTTLVSGIDFTGLSQNSNIKPDYRALWAGDFNSDGLIKYTNPNDDINILFFEVIAHPNNNLATTNFDFAHGYYNGDYDMNGKVKFDNPNDDTNFELFQVLGFPFNTQTLANYAFFLEQVPR